MIRADRFTPALPPARSPWPAPNGCTSAPGKQSEKGGVRFPIVNHGVDLIKWSAPRPPLHHHGGVPLIVAAVDQRLLIPFCRALAGWPSTAFAPWRTCSPSIGRELASAVVAGLPPAGWPHSAALPPGPHLPTGPLPPPAPPNRPAP